MTTNADPVVIMPSIENGALVQYTGLLNATTQIATGTLASVTQKNRATPQLTQSSTGATGAVNQFIVNATHPSGAWVNKVVAGTTFSDSQPVVRIPIPFPFGNVAEVDTWTTGDSFTSYAPAAINIIAAAPTFADYNGAETSQFIVSNLTIFDPGGVAQDSVFIGQHVQLIEVASQRAIQWNADAPYIAAIAANDDFFGGQTGGQISTRIGAPIEMFAGIAGGSLSGFTSFSGFRMLDDVLVNGTSNVAVLNEGQISTMYVATGVIMALIGGADATLSFAGDGGPVIWGPGTLNVSAGRVIYPAGAGGAAATFKQTGLRISNVTTNACSVVLSTGVWTCTNAVTAAQLDVVAGASLGGLVVQPGGASISNGSL